MSSSMHVCLVTPYPESDARVIGGVEAASLRLVNALIADGRTRVSVVAPTTNARFERRGAVDIHWTEARLSFLPGILTYWTTERIALQAAARRTGADVVHFQAIAGWGIGYRGPRVFLMHGVPEETVMFTPRKTRWLSRLIHLAVERPGRRSFEVAAVVSAHMRSRFASQFGGSVAIAENTVPDAYFRVVRKPVKGRVLFGGVVSYLKNVHGILEAFRGVHTEMPDASLHIAGATTSFPDYVERCRGFVEKNCLVDKVRFLGSISIEEMKQQLAEAEVLVLPSFKESAPVMICEAMAMGIPVISSRRDGMPYMISDCETGFLIEPEDIASIQRRITELLTSRSLNDSMGAAAKAVASQRFTERALAETMKRCYEEAVRNSSRQLAEGTA